MPVPRDAVEDRARGSGARVRPAADGFAQLPRRRRRHRRRRGSGPRIKPHVASTSRPEVIGGIGGFGGAVRARPRQATGAGARLVHRRRRHEGDGRDGDRPLRHDRHRPRRDVRGRHRVPGRRAALVPRLHLGRPASIPTRSSSSSPASPRAAGRPAARSSAARWPSTRRDGQGRVRSRGLRGGRRRARRGSSPATHVARRRRARSACRLRACARTATRSRGERCSTSAARSLDDAAWEGADHSLADELLRPSVIYAPGDRRAAPSTVMCTASPTSPAAGCGQRAARAAPRPRRRDATVELGGAARSSARSSALGGASTTRDGAGVQPRDRDGRRRRP